MVFGANERESSLAIRFYRPGVVDNAISILLDALQKLLDLKGRMEVTFLGKQIDPRLRGRLETLKKVGWQLAYGWCIRRSGG